MAGGWNLRVWLECIGAAIIIITFPFSTCITVGSQIYAINLFMRNAIFRFFSQKLNSQIK